MNVGTKKLKNIELYDDFFNGTCKEAYELFGNKFSKENRRNGFRFTVWAPNAKSISVVGDFNQWDGNKNPLVKVNDKGIWSGFIPGIKHKDLYKYEIETLDDKKLMKCDPFGRLHELRPNTATLAYQHKIYKWKDDKWIKNRENISLYESPINIYEVHLGSWKRDENGDFLTYRQLAKELPRYVKEMGYTHIELMPIMEHPLDDSWGYQLTGYYSVTSRYGNVEDFKYFIDMCHRSGIGVILDWVPGHFCKDSHGLYRFDGTSLYEYSDEWKSENKGWGAANFDLGKKEIQNFLISNAFYWIKEFHVDGFRIDAVANILYLDYGRDTGQWVPNKYGGNVNLEGKEFFKLLNSSLESAFNNIFIIAEESTTYPNVTSTVESGGLGFNLKWNMGWMNDVLKYIELDPLYRKWNHNALTFPMMYAHTENFILPISHDEVVHGKKSLIGKMWGDYWNKFAGLRAFLLFMYTHPGKKSIFMGNEIAQFIEWRFYEELEWHLLNFETHNKIKLFVKELNHLYLKEKALWQGDYKDTGFKWIDPNNSNQSIIIYRRMGYEEGDILIVVCNFTNIVYYDYKIGVPVEGAYEEILNTDDKSFGGSGQTMGETLFSIKEKWHNEKNSLTIKVPPMAGVILKLKQGETLDESLTTAREK